MLRHEFNQLDDLSRRLFMERLAKRCLGLSIVPFLPAAATNAMAAPTVAAAGKAKHVIYLFMAGAMSHLETFDPKPKSDKSGETKAISTAIPGVQFSEHLPTLAKQAKRLAVVRSMTTETGAHEQGQYLMRTSYKQIASTRHPFMGSWAQLAKGKLNATLPGSVTIGGANRHPGAGFLNATLAPAPVGSAKAGLENTKGPKYVTEELFDKRLRLTSKFERTFRTRYKHREVDSYVDFYREATSLLKSPDLLAFDINQEEESVREAYGANAIGQGCLLARRLVEKRVRYIEINAGGWDNHRDIFSTIPDKAGELDKAVGTLLNDLNTRGMLKDTLVVIGTEFGRTPKINQNAGRDHHPGAFSVMLAGGGIRGGQVYGASDKDGQSVEEDHATPSDINATIAKALGIDVKKEFISPTGRPFTVANDGEPLDKLLG